MSSSGSSGALIALNRFGLGPRPGDLAKAAADPRGLLRADLLPDNALIEPGPAETPVLTGTAANIQAAYAAQDARKAARQMGEQATMASSSTIMAGSAPSGASFGAQIEKPKASEPTPEARIYRNEAQARFQKAADPEVGLLERLVAFWSNHFCVSVAKADIFRATAGSFEPRVSLRPMSSPARRL